MEEQAKERFAHRTHAVEEFELRDPHGCRDKGHGQLNKKSWAMLL
jgi:hypothetical protein